MQTSFFLTKNLSEIPTKALSNSFYRSGMFGTNPKSNRVSLDQFLVQIIHGTRNMLVVSSKAPSLAVIVGLSMQLDCYGWSWWPLMAKVEFEPITQQSHGKQIHGKPLQRKLSNAKQLNRKPPYGK